MTELDCLLAAVKANHADDTPRLVLADWLDEHGQGERAEFVRAQVELADACLPGVCVCTKRCDGLRAREKELWEANASRWFSNDALGPFRRTIFPVMPEQGIRRIWERTAEELMSGPFFGQREAWSWHNGSSYIEASASRGFLSRIRCTAADWLAHGDAILVDPWTPGLDEVELSEWQFSGSAPWFSDPTPENAEACLRIRWPDVRKWTIPPEGGFRVPEEFTPELLRRLGLAPSSPDLP